MAQQGGNSDRPEQSGGALRADMPPARKDSTVTAPGPAGAGLFDRAHVAVAVGRTGPSSLAVLDERGRIVLTTPAWDELFGYGEGELLGASVRPLLPPPAGTTAEPGNHPAAGSGGGGALPRWGQRRDGSRFPIETDSSPMISDDRCYAVVTARAVTPQPGGASTAPAGLSAPDGAVLEERQRIAGRLLGEVVPLLFGAGLAVSAISDRISDEVVREQVAEAVLDVDAAIADLRSVIFDLSPPPPVHSLRDRVVELCAAECDQHDITTNVQFRGAIDMVALPQAEALLAVLREALAHLSLRGDVTTVDVGVEADGDLALRVEGHGPATAGTQPGNGHCAFDAIVEQADALGGVNGVCTGAARFDWRAPRS